MSDVTPTPANRNEIPQELLDDIKNYLNITWPDDATDKKVRGIIAGGIAYLNDKGGAEYDYNLDGEPRTLLFDYCRYARDDALDVFENNYRHRIVLLGIRTKAGGLNGKKTAEPTE